MIKKCYLMSMMSIKVSENYELKIIRWTILLAQNIHEQICEYLKLNNTTIGFFFITFFMCESYCIFFSAVLTSGPTKETNSILENFSSICKVIILLLLFVNNCWWSSMFMMGQIGQRLFFFSIWPTIHFKTKYCGFNYFCGFQFLWIAEKLSFCGYLISWFCHILHTKW